MRFNSAPEHAIVLEFQAGEWGPSAEHTDLRFYGQTLNDVESGKLEYWLWEGTHEHCAVCEEGDGYPDYLKNEEEQPKEKEEQEQPKKKEKEVPTVKEPE